MRGAPSTGAKTARPQDAWAPSARRDLRSVRAGATSSDPQLASVVHVVVPVAAGEWPADFERPASRQRCS